MEEKANTGLEWDDIFFNGTDKQMTEMSGESFVLQQTLAATTEVDYSSHSNYCTLFLS